MLPSMLEPHAARPPDVREAQLSPAHSRQSEHKTSK